VGGCQSSQQITADGGNKKMHQRLDAELHSSGSQSVVTPCITLPLSPVAAATAADSISAAGQRLSTSAAVQLSEKHDIVHSVGQRWVLDSELQKIWFMFIAAYWFPCIFSHDARDCAEFIPVAGQRYISGGSGFGLRPHAGFISPEKKMQVLDDKLQNFSDGKSRDSDGRLEPSMIEDKPVLPPLLLPPMAPSMGEGVLVPLPSLAAVLQDTTTGQRVGICDYMSNAPGMPGSAALSTPPCSEPPVTRGGGC
jgi:hypothetical protein